MGCMYSLLEKALEHISFQWVGIATLAVTTAGLALQQRKQIKDERASRMKVKIKRPRNAKTVDGWTPIGILFDNPGRDVLKVIKMSIPKSSGFILARPDQTRDSSSAAPLPEAASFTFTDLPWSVKPENLTWHDGDKFSSHTLIFIKPSSTSGISSILTGLKRRLFKKRSSVKISFVYRSIARKSPQIKISASIDINDVNQSDRP